MQPTPERSSTALSSRIPPTRDLRDNKKHDASTDDSDRNSTQNLVCFSLLYTLLHCVRGKKGGKNLQFASSSQSALSPPFCHTYSPLLYPSESHRDTKEPEHGLKKEGFLRQAEGGSREVLGERERGTY